MAMSQMGPIIQKRLSYPALDLLQCNVNLLWELFIWTDFNIKDLICLNKFNHIVIQVEKLEKGFLKCQIGKNVKI